VGRERPRGKDWNEDLQEREERRAREREAPRQQAQEQQHDRGGWDHDR